MQRGFTLLEILITLFLISLITLFAMPRYEAPLLQTKHLGAKVALLDLANALQSYYAFHRTYQNVTAEKLGVNIYAVPDYELKIFATTCDTFKIAAIPKNEKIDPCGTFYLDQEGNKTTTDVTHSVECWK